MNEPSGNEDSATKDSTLWAKLGVADWEVGWTGLLLTWLFSPVWLKVTLALLLAVAMSWTAKASRPAMPSDRPFREAFKDFATGKVMRLIGCLYVALTVGVFYFAYLALRILDSGGKGKDAPTTLTEAYAKAHRDIWETDVYGWAASQWRETVR